jgi:DNA polymerase-3 subunit alpha
LKEFCHTHVHSDYSLLDSSVSATNLAKDAAAKGMKAMALTDHGNVMGHVEFYKACRKAGIKPILGCELYVARRSASEKMDKWSGNPTDHLVVLAENQEGYKNLLKLVSHAYQNGFHYVPRVDLELLAKHSKGLIAQTACLSGGVNRLLGGWSAWHPSEKIVAPIAPNYEEAKALANRLRDIFGPDNFFMEVQHHAGKYQDPELVDRQRKLATEVLKLSKELGIPLVGTNDIHFRQPTDAHAREIALYISRGRTKSDADKMDSVSHAGEFYIKTAEEMEEVFRGHPSLMDNTLLIAERCNVELEIDKFHFARPIHEGHELTDEEIQQRWEFLLAQGMHKKYGEENEAAMARLQYEKKVIEKMGFVPYFLIVADYVNYAKARGIPVGPGRGSIGGCLTANVLDITRVNPLRHDLLFERFLNPDRISMPDIDVDFCKDRVGEVRDYLISKYGKDRVAKIATIGALWARGVIREVGKILEMPGDDIEDLAKSIPPGGGEFQVGIADALGHGNPDLIVPKIKALTESSDPKLREFAEVCEKLEGIKRSIGTHACGIVISDKPLEEYVSLLPVKDDDTLLQTGAEMGSIETLGLLKMDLLMLATLTVISRALKWVKERHGKDIDIWEAVKEYDDPSVYDLICSGRTLGLFQIETGLMRKAAMRIQPRNIEDISAIVALNRPGPLDYIDANGLNMVDHYILRRRGEEAVTYPHPSLEPVLKETLGIIVYQEHVMKISQVLCGFTGGEADSLRKGIGKKLPEVIAKEKQKFIPAAMKHSGLSQAAAEDIWHQVETFARYGFNKSHSIAYSYITYATGWLKLYYPVEYMASLLTNAAGSVDDENLEQSDTKTRQVEDIAKYIYECNQMGIDIFDPDVNVSVSDSVPEGYGIRAGLRMIKEVGDASFNIVAARSMTSGRFESFEDFVSKCCLMGVTRSSFVPLINAGAVPFGDRNQLLANLDRIINRTRAKAKRDKEDEELKLLGLPPKKRKKSKTADQLAADIEWTPMPEEQARAESLGAIGAYLLPRFPCVAVSINLGESDNLFKLIELIKAHRGNVLTYARVVVDGLQVDFSLSRNNGSDEFLAEARKLGRVKET